MAFCGHWEMQVASTPKKADGISSMSVAKAVAGPGGGPASVPSKPGDQGQVLTALQTLVSPILAYG